jgi:hypothetical protein
MRSLTVLCLGVALILGTVHGGPAIGQTPTWNANVYGLIVPATHEPVDVSQYVVGNGLGGLDAHGGDAGHFHFYVRGGPGVGYACGYAIGEVKPGGKDGTETSTEPPIVATWNRTDWIRILRQPGTGSLQDGDRVLCVATCIVDSSAEVFLPFLQDLEPGLSERADMYASVDFSVNTSILNSINFQSHALKHRVCGGLPSDCTWTTSTDTVVTINDVEVPRAAGYELYFLAQVGQEFTVTSSGNLTANFRVIGETGDVACFGMASAILSNVGVLGPVDAQGHLLPWPAGPKAIAVAWNNQNGQYLLGTQEGKRNPDPQYTSADIVWMTDRLAGDIFWDDPNGNQNVDVTDLLEFVDSFGAIADITSFFDGIEIVYDGPDIDWDATLGPVDQNMAAYKPWDDINGDGAIDVVDLLMLNGNFGLTAPPPPAW